MVAYKLSPAGATTNSDSGVTDVAKCLPTLRTMAEVRVLCTLCMLCCACAVRAPCVWRCRRAHAPKLPSLGGMVVVE